MPLWLLCECFTSWNKCKVVFIYKFITQGAQYFWQQISDMEGSFKDVLTTVQFINSFLNRKQCLAFYIFKNIDKATKTTTKKCYQ